MLYVSGDLPLATPEEISFFVRGGQALDCDYALGLTQVRLVDYFMASIGMLPGTLLYVYTGKVAGDVAAIAGGQAGEKGVGDWLVLVLGLIATAIVTVLVTRIARRSLAVATGEDGHDGSAV